MIFTLETLLESSIFGIFYKRCRRCLLVVRFIDISIHNHKEKLILFTKNCQFYYNLFTFITLNNKLILMTTTIKIKSIIFKTTANYCCSTIFPIHSSEIYINLPIIIISNYSILQVSIKLLFICLLFSFLSNVHFSTVIYHLDFCRKTYVLLNGISRQNSKPLSLADMHK